MFLTSWLRNRPTDRTPLPRAERRRPAPPHRDTRARPWAERLEDRDVPAVITVSTAADQFSANSDLSLREAIELVNGDLSFGDLSKPEQKLVSGTAYSGVGGTDTIRFKIGHGPGRS